MLSTKTMPYCPGCGHKSANQNLDKAILSGQWNPLDIIIVSDIGCCGLIDSLVQCHTIHGIHGRSTALALGISLGLQNPEKKIIVIIGDGGATIGLQHLLESARRNVDITVILLNNMVYGMTGGQISGLTTKDYKLDHSIPDSHVPHFDIVELVNKAGASFCTRIMGHGNYSDRISNALSIKGFSLVEIVGLCIPYGVNKAHELDYSGYKEITYYNDREPYSIDRNISTSLFNSILSVNKNYVSQLDRTLRIVIAGSAGEGVQLASSLLAQASIITGLHTTQKGEYPITVGTGFSLSEVILSNKKIHYTGIHTPDILIVTAQEGLDMVKNKWTEIPLLIIDESLSGLQGTDTVIKPFRHTIGHKGATLGAIAFWIMKSNIFPVEVLYEAIHQRQLSEKLFSSLDKARLLI